MESINQITKKKPSKIEEMTKEQIRQAILKKKECSAKAQQVVESLLERDVTDEFLLQCLPDINQSHLEDIFDERAIIHICGYPICTKTLSLKDIPKQKYRISLKTNKVYDITARKKFCSNICYNAAMYVKKQLLTSPLWFREYEEMPKFHLMDIEHIGGMGEEIDVALVSRVKFAEPKSFTSINDFAQASIVDVPDDFLNHHSEETGDTPITDVLNHIPENNDQPKECLEHQPTTQNYKKDVDKLTKDMTHVCVTTISDTPEQALNTTTNNTEYSTRTVNQKESINLSNKVPDVNKETGKNGPKVNQNPLNLVGDIVEKPEKRVDPILTTLPETSNRKRDSLKSKVILKKQPVITALTIEVEKCLAEWFTLDTMLFLFDNERVREMVADKGECIKEYLNNYSKSIFYSSNTYDQYQALCKKLNMLELEDRKFDSGTIKQKPLPTYAVLQEESKTMQLKVKAFYSARTDVEPVLDESTSQSIPEDSNVTILPLVDKNSQNALRRRIVCQYLNRMLPDLLRSLDLLSLQISADVNLLVNTFKLKANNIMFKPIQWTLIAIVFIKLLSIRNKRLEHLLEQPTAYNHMQLLLLSFKQDGGYLDRLICWLTDIDRLLDTNDTQFTN